MKVMRKLRNAYPYALIIVLLVSCNIFDNDDDEGTRVSSYDLNSEIIQTSVTNIKTGLENVFSTMIEDSLARVNLSRAFVNDAIFLNDESGYFFIATLDDGRIVAHINQEILGTSLLNNQDVNGKYFVQEMINTVSTSGSGFVEYFYLNPATGEDEDKLSFVSGISSENWFIGSGFYHTESQQQYEESEANELVVADLVEATSKGISGVFNEIYTDSLDQLAFSSNLIDEITFFDDESGYFFVFDMEGLCIAHGAEKEREGTDMWDIQDSKGAYIIRDMVGLLQNNPEGVFYEYYWRNPNTGNDEPKKSYVTMIPNTSYFIGAGVYQE